MSNSASPPPSTDPQRLRDLKPEQLKSGLAAWLGWLFDGLDMHLYTAVATTFVALLLQVEEGNPEIKTKSSIIQAAFLVGWAVGGGFFGRIGDKLGRSRALMLTILTYAAFTGLSFFAQTWWQLMIFRFLAALGIGGEWAVGASLLSETWPKKWRPWMAATLQTGVNIGILLAMGCSLLLQLLPGYQSRNVFLIGILPALITVWIRKAVPETEEWKEARKDAPVPRIADLFRGTVRPITIMTILVCSLSLTAHWAFTFWSPQHMGNLAKLELGADSKKQEFIKMIALSITMFGAIVGNYFGGWMAKKFQGFRFPIAIFCVAYCVTLLAAFTPHWSLTVMWFWLFPLGMCGGVFALFTMYMPPLFPTLLRTTGAGFCYNIGRLVAAGGTIYFGLLATVEDFRPAMFYSGFLFLPAALFACLLPEAIDETPDLEPVD